jgi:hypothetical protein
MKKTLLLVAAMALLLSTTSLATETRVLTMGDNNAIMIDDANIWLFPGRLLDYPNLAIGEFDSSDDFAKMGVHWKFGTDNPWVVATYIATTPSELASNLYGGATAETFTRFTTLPDPTHMRGADLMVSHEFFNWNWGLHFSGRGTALERDDSGSKMRESFDAFLIDLGISEPLGKWDFGLGLHFGSWKDKDADGAVETEPDGYTDYSILYRRFYDINPTWDLVPHIGLVYSKHGETDHLVDGDIDTRGDLTTKSEAFDFALGLGFRYTPAPNVFAVIDFTGVRSVQTQDRSWTADAGVVVTGDPALNVPGSDEAKQTELMGVWRIGVEGDVFKWLTIRLGAVGRGITYQDEYPDYPIGGTPFIAVDKEHYNANDTYLGFSFHWDRLYIDTHTSPQLITDGLNFISGSDDARDMNFRVSVLYEMF